VRIKNRLVRLFRALSDLTQRAFAETTGMHPAVIAQWELDHGEPGPEELKRAARGAALTVAAGEQVLRFADTLRLPRQRAGQGAEGLKKQLAALLDTIYVSLLRFPLPIDSPRAEDRQQAAELWVVLKDLPEDQQLSVVRVAPEYQSWALAEVVCEESVEHASRDLERASSLARLAQEIADRVRGLEGWCKRLRGYVAAHQANILRVAGKLKAAEIALTAAKMLFHSGSEPTGLLDPGRLLDLEAALRRDQRRFDEALACLDEAVVVSRFPARTLVMQGSTLEVMGDYERAVAALLKAGPLIDRKSEPRLWYKQRANLAVAYCDVGRHAEAALLIEEARAVATELGDVIELSRMTWLEGRIAAGLGLAAEARRLLEQARQEFAGRKMWYDVALALLEIAALLLDAGRTAEVKTLAGDLAVVFESEGVHREALAALKLFQEAAEREAATAELARRVLRFLFRARYDEGLRFGAS